MPVLQVWPYFKNQAQQRWWPQSLVLVYQRDALHDMLAPGRADKAGCFPVHNVQQTPCCDVHGRKDTTDKTASAIVIEAQKTYAPLGTT